MLLYDRYTYNRQQGARNRMLRWYCAKYHAGCKVTVLTTSENIVTKVVGEHNHAKPILHELSDVTYTIRIKENGHKCMQLGNFYFGPHYTRRLKTRWRCVRHNIQCNAVVYTLVVFVHNMSGKRLAIYNGYSFYCGVQSSRTYTWRCTRWGNCKSRFILSANSNVLITGNFDHSHEPPPHVIRNGIYIRV
ncbi:unnamed protein product [Pieris macdunnoughi]|uniref:FLYWCH-type domain-containing protein n=1 Tax=Pieris macdunnoughi TaxID=345717 RepID=A0A821QAA8_9NEOP|nr:unnamed protein product [Pieris macdunnoughi]